MTQDATPKVISEFHFDVFRKPESRFVLLPCRLQQRLEILGNDAVEQSPRQVGAPIAEGPYSTTDGRGPSKARNARRA
jgi:hypothetical protein